MSALPISPARARPAGPLPGAATERVPLLRPATAVSGILTNVPGEVLCDNDTVRPGLRAAGGYSFERA
jgi:hypothetical protein